MEIFASPIGVAVLLALVATAALAWQPSEYAGSWAKLASQFESKLGPQSIDFPNESVEVDGEFTFFGVTIARDGVWLVYDGPAPKKSPDFLYVPMNSIRIFRETSRTIAFRFGEDKTVIVEFRREIGSQIARWIPDGS